jgi:hypothetical protein
MLMECLIKREGPTNINIGKTPYVFGPIPSLTGGDEYASVCPMNKQEDIDYLLQMPSLYREYTKKTPTELRAAEMEYAELDSKLQELIDNCTDPEALRLFLAKELNSVNARGWVEDAIAEKLKDMEDVPVTRSFTKLSVEAYQTITNPPQLKSLIKKCEDVAVVREILDLEKKRSNPREWAGEALADKLDELEK